MLSYELNNIKYVHDTLNDLYKYNAYKRKWQTNLVEILIRSNYLSNISIKDFITNIIPIIDMVFENSKIMNHVRKSLTTYLENNNENLYKFINENILKFINEDHHYN